MVEYVAVAIGACILAGITVFSRRRKTVREVLRVVRRRNR